ncbi:MAG: carboxylating nicotinate-nucleotide diphosphorylase [Anaerolineae bacterium]
MKLEPFDFTTDAAQAGIAQIVSRGLAEDVGDGDVTSLLTVPENALVDGDFIAKEAGVVAGLAVVIQVFAQVSDQVQVTPLVADGERVAVRQVIATIRGDGRAILTGERVALNFLQRMSGIATATRRYVDAVQGTRAIILDTRKTAPGLRVLDKWAVRLGGGQNHRFGLYDMAMIKDNHIAAVGSLTAAVQRVRQGDARQRPIEVEVTTLAQLAEALQQPVDRILLDNMPPEQMAVAVQMTAGRIPLEASGNVNLNTVTAIAATGVDYISIGALTHSVKALDISLDLRDST